MSPGSLRAMKRNVQRAGHAATYWEYPGTGHWFAEPSQAAYDPAAAALAHERTLAFLAERLTGGR